jgi:hypothetical protein
MTTEKTVTEKTFSDFKTESTLFQDSKPASEPRPPVTIPTAAEPPKKAPSAPQEADEGKPSTSFAHAVARCCGICEHLVWAADVASSLETQSF